MSILGTIAIPRWKSRGWMNLIAATDTRAALLSWAPMTDKRKRLTELVTCGG